MRARHQAPPVTTIRSHRVKTAIAVVVGTVTALVAAAVTSEGVVQAVMPHS